MNKQMVVFLGLIVIAGFIFFRTNEADAPQDSGTDDSNLEITIEEIETGTNEKDGDDINEEVMEKKTEEVMKKTTEKEDEQEPSELTVINIEGQSFSPYTNKAINYTIDRPDNWYWQHFFVTELTPEENSDDILALDRKPLSEENIYTSMIIIDRVEGEVKIPEGHKTSATVGGKDADRYETESSVTYIVDLENGKTLRFIYNPVEQNENEKIIFEYIVNSFSLN